jgi:hypothetical protein
MSCCYVYILEYLKLHNLHKMRYHLDAPLLIQVYLGSEICPCLLETVGPRVPPRHIRDFLCSVYSFQVKIFTSASFSASKSI